MPDIFARVWGGSWIRLFLLAVSLALGLTACGAKVPEKAPAGTGPNQPLIWDSGTWDNNQWT